MCACRSKAVEATSLDNWEQIQVRLIETKEVDPNGEIVFEADNWAKKAIKQKFKDFNHQFEKQYGRQKVWSIPDPELRAQIRNQNVKKVLSPYEALYQRSIQVAFSRNRSKHMKFSPEMLQRMMAEFFEHAP